MRKIFHIIDSISEWSGKIVSFLIYAGMLMLVYEVAARYFFNSPTMWAHGYSQRIFGTYFILLGAFTLLKGAHVRVDILYQQFVRIRPFLDILNYAMLILWVAVLVWEGTHYFMYSWSIGELDESALRHPVYPVKLFLVIGSLLILLQGISMLAQNVTRLIKGERHES